MSREDEPALAPSPRRRPGRFRRLVLRPFVWGFVVLAAAALALSLYLDSDAFRSRARGFLVAQLSEALGRPVTVASASVELFPLALEISDLVIPGPTPESPPVAVVPFLRIEAEVTGFLDPGISLERIWVRRPQLYLAVDENGRTNLPQPPASKGGRQGLEIEVGTLLVEDGSFRLDEREVPLEVLATDVHSTWSRVAEGRYQGHLSAGTVGVLLPAGQPYPVGLSLDLTWAAGKLSIAEGRIAGQSLELAVDGSFETGADGDRLDLAFRGTSAFELLTELGYLDGEVVGPVEVEGAVAWSAGQPWRLTGTARAPAVDARSWQAADLAVSVDGGPRRLDLTVESLAFLGGSVGGTAWVDLADRQNPVTLEFEVEGAEVRRVFAGLGVEIPGLAGRVSGPVRYRLLPAALLGGDGLLDLKLEPDATDREAVAFAGRVPLRLAGGRLLADRLELASPAQQATIAGLSVGLADGAGGFAFRVDTADAGELAAQIPVGEGEPPAWLPTSGEGTVSGRLDFGPSGITAKLDLDLAPVATPAFTAEEAFGSLLLSGDALEQMSLEIRDHGAGASVSGRVPFAAAEPLELAVRLNGWPYRDLEAFVPVELPLEGPVSGLLNLVGTADALRGNLEASMAPVEVAGLAARRLALTLAFDADEVRLRTARLELPAGPIEARGSIGLGAGTPLDLAVSAPELVLGQAPLDLLGTAGNGRLALAGRLSGSLEKPEGELTVVSSGLSAGGNEIPSARLAGSWDGKRLALDGSLLGLVEVSGGGRLDAEQADLSFRVSSQRLDTFAALAGLDAPPGSGGSFAGQLAVRGRTREPEVALELDPIALSWGTYQLANLEPARARFAAESVRIDSLYLGAPSQQAEVFLGGSIGFSGRQPLNLHLQATAPAGWLPLEIPGVALEGTVSALGTVTGTLSEPALSGQADVAGGELRLADFPHSITDASAVVLIYPRQAVLDRLEGRFAGGQVQGSGTVELPGLDYRFQASLVDAHLLYPEGWVIDADAELSLTPTPGGRIVRGNVRLARALFVQDVRLGLTDLLGDFLRRRRLTVGLPDPALATTQLNVVVSGPGALVIRNNLAELVADADLVVRGSLARPILVGQVQARPGGTLVYNETSYEIDRGLLTFASLDQLDPVIDLVATAEVRSYEVRLTLSGTLERLTTSFSSNPPLPNLDVLALLTSGGRVDEIRAGQPPGPTTPGEERYAERLLGQAAQTALTTRVKSLFGFDKLRIDPTFSSSGSLSAARVIAGKQINRDLFVTYQYDASTNRESLVEVEWRVAPELTVVLSSIDAEQYAVDLRWEKRF
ncbi:MAG TPA: translocation/assembly module TamB domain-containing protein [Thermoanaerobaculia bacterium]|nr:translocation/assembly module TamB domain-containing protein [Thermoanaerobaculia bacterium]